MAVAWETCWVVLMAVLSKRDEIDILISTFIEDTHKVHNTCIASINIPDETGAT